MLYHAIAYEGHQLIAIGRAGRFLRSIHGISAIDGIDDDVVVEVPAIINDKGRAAGRSGVGAVMGSKKLKAIAVSGTQKIPIFDPEQTKALRKKYRKQSNK